MSDCDHATDPPARDGRSVVRRRDREHSVGGGAGAVGLVPDRIQALQRSAGNGAVRHLLAVQRNPLTDPLHAPPPTKDLSPGRDEPGLMGKGAYIDFGRSSIESYRTAARQGIDDFKDATSPDFDWGLFGVQVLGNLIWAGACFATGGTAFVISLAGIGVTTAGAAATVVTAPSFDNKAKKDIDGVREYLFGGLNRVTDSVYAQAQREGWGHLRTEEEILKRLVTPVYISKTGGVPSLETPAITAAVEQQLLIGANATQPRKGSAASAALYHNIPTVIRDRYTGYVMYSYKVGGVVHDEGFWHSDTMNDPSRWKLESGPAVALVPSANVGDINSSMNEAQHKLHGDAMHIATWPCKKAINVYEDSPEHPIAVVRFDEGSQFVDVEGWGVVHSHLEDNPHLTVGVKIANRVWGRLTPPDVAQLAAPPKLFEVNTSPSFAP